MKKYLTISFLLCFCFVHASYSQQLYAELNLESGKIEDIQAFEAQDSIFLTYLDKDIMKAFWIDRRGTKSQVYLTHVGDVRLCGIEKESDTIFYYYLKEEKKRLELHALRQVSTGGNIYSGGRPVYLDGDVMALQVDDNELIVVSYQKEINKIAVNSINRARKRLLAEVPAPEEFNKYASSSGLITGGLATIPQGSMPTKIYKDGGLMVLTIDEERFPARKSATKVLRLNLDSGQYNLYSVPGPEDDQFSSFYHDDKLFRLSTSVKSFEWLIYDIPTVKPLYKKAFIRDRSMREQNVVVRTADSHEVGHGNLYHTMGQYSEPSIVVEPVANTSELRITSGTFQNSKGVVLAGGMSPAAILAGLLIHNFVNQLQPPPGIQHYFHLKGNLEKGFELEGVQNGSPRSTRQLIDDYEISRTSGVPKGAEKWSWFLLYKGYLQIKNGALGIYVEKRKDQKKLILLKYTNI